MAIFHFSAQIVSRAAGRSSVAAAAYRSASKMVDGHTGQVHDFRRKGGVAHSEVLIPDHAPAWMGDPQRLWNAVEVAEKRRDAQLCREINIALPVELSPKQQLALTREFCRKEFVAQGMVAQLDMHDLRSGNPHFHVMLTMRDIKGEGFGNKNRGWNHKSSLQQWRQAWAEMANKHLEMAGHAARIDHRSLVDQGIEDREPTQHLGPHAAGYEDRTGNASDKRLRWEAEMRERAQKAAREKVKEAELAAELAAAEAEALALEHELAELQHQEQPSTPAPTPARPSADEIRRALAQAQAALRPPAELAEQHPDVRRAAQRASEQQRVAAVARQRQYDAEGTLAGHRGSLSDTRQALADWRRVHRLRSWLHDQGLVRAKPLAQLEQAASKLEIACTRGKKTVQKATKTAQEAVLVAASATDTLEAVRRATVAEIAAEQAPARERLEALQAELVLAQAREQVQGAMQGAVLARTRDTVRKMVDAEAERAQRPRMGR